MSTVGIQVAGPKTPVVLENVLLPNRIYHVDGKVTSTLTPDQESQAVQFVQQQLRDAGFLVYYVRLDNGSFTAQISTAQTPPTRTGIFLVEFIPAILEILGIVLIIIGVALIAQQAPIPLVVFIVGAIMFYTGYRLNKSILGLIRKIL